MHSPNFPVPMPDVFVHPCVVIAIQNSSQCLFLWFWTQLCLLVFVFMPTPCLDLFAMFGMTTCFFSKNFAIWTLYPVCISALLCNSLLPRITFWDIKNTYFQLPFCPDHKLFPWSHFQRQAYQFLVLPFGLSLSSWVFTRVVAGILYNRRICFI